MGLGDHCKDFGCCPQCCWCHQRVLAGVGRDPRWLLTDRKCWKQGHRQEATAVIQVGEDGGRGPEAEVMKRRILDLLAGRESPLPRAWSTSSIPSFCALPATSSRGDEGSLRERPVPKLGASHASLSEFSVYNASCSHLRQHGGLPFSSESGRERSVG